MQLFDLRSGELIGSARTDEYGYYEFPGSGDGLYVVRVSESRYPGTQGYDEAVEVASNAAREVMPGFVVDHVCDSGLALVNPDSESQEPCVPTGAADPMPPMRYQPYWPYYTPPVIVLRQQVVVVR